MKKDRSYLIIKICFIMIMISFVTFYETHASFTDSQELLTNISITTGTLDIQLKDRASNTNGDQSYILRLNQTTKSQVIGNLTIEDIGSLSSSLSAKVMVDGPIELGGLFKVILVDSVGNETLLSNNYKLVNGIHNTGNTFSVKILYTGAFPIDASEFAVKVELKATQPNDDYSSPKMFTDKQEIRFVKLQNIQIAFSDGIPIEGTVNIKHNEDIYIDILPKGLNIEDVKITFRDGKFFKATYDKTTQKVQISVNGNNNSDVIKITVKLSSGEIYYLERDIQSTN